MSLEATFLVHPKVLKTRLFGVETRIKNQLEN
jgi:hypothetical protein